MKFKTQEQRDAYNARRREDWARHKDTINAYRRWRYANDEEYREKHKRAEAERRKTDEYRAKHALEVRANRQRKRAEL